MYPENVHYKVHKVAYAQIPMCNIDSKFPNKTEDDIIPKKDSVEEAGRFEQVLERTLVEMKQPES